MFTVGNACIHDHVLENEMGLTNKSEDWTINCGANISTRLLNTLCYKYKLLLAIMSDARNPKMYLVSLGNTICCINKSILFNVSNVIKFASLYESAIPSQFG